MSRSDILVLILALATVGGLYGLLWQGAAPGERARIHAPDGQGRTVALDRPRTIEVSGRLGVSTLRIAEGRVRFADSPCRNKVCVHAGWLGAQGELAACLPNGISVEVVDTDHGFDAINY